jgi:hypothetical protein
MGAHIAFTRAPALRDPNGRPLSMEFSVAAILSSHLRDLRGGGAAHGVAVNDCSYHRASAGRSNGDRSVYLPDGWFLHSSAWLDFSWIGRRLVFVGIGRTPFQISTVGARCNHNLRAPGNVSLHADKLRSSPYNFSQELLKPEPLDPQRLYLSVYPWAELTYAATNKPQPVGQTLRPGSTSMWAGLRFINGYSPIRAAGVAREFATSIHGEINPDVGSHLLNHQAGSEGELALMGVDGIVVAKEVSITPQPSSEWELVASTDEGNVFHRRSAPFTRVRSVSSIDSRPNEQFVLATVNCIDESRKFVDADIYVPSGDRPALLTFSRPYFRGYQAHVGKQELAVTSYRGLFPIVEVPGGVHGRLTLIYRPAWLLWGGSLAVACGLIVLLGAIAGYRYSSSTVAESGG